MKIYRNTSATNLKTVPAVCMTELYDNKCHPFYHLVVMPRYKAKRNIVYITP